MSGKGSSKAKTNQRGKARETGLFHEPGRSGTVGLGFGPEKMRVTYTLGQLRPTPEDPVIDGLPWHYLLTLNQNMGVGGNPTNPTYPNTRGVSGRDLKQNCLI